MAPTQSTCPALTTRSVARKNGISLRSLDAGVRKYYQCIICDKKNGSRAALSRHFKSHTTRPEELSPFTHPSCKFYLCSIFALFGLLFGSQDIVAGAIHS